jgi:hypothetical protein
MQTASGSRSMVGERTALITRLPAILLERRITVRRLFTFYADNTTRFVGVYCHSTFHKVPEGGFRR